MRFLKAAVILGGILLFFGFLTLAVMMATQDGDGEGERASGSRNGDIPWESRVALYPGERVDALSPLGSGVAVLIVSPDGSGRLAMLDRRGRLKGQTRFVHEPAFPEQPAGGEPPAEGD